MADQRPHPALARLRGVLTAYDFHNYDNEYMRFLDYITSDLLTSDEMGEMTDAELSEADGLVEAAFLRVHLASLKGG